MLLTNVIQKYYKNKSFIYLFIVNGKHIQKLEWMPSPAGPLAKLITSPCFGAKVLTVSHKMAKGYRIIMLRKK